MTSDSTPTYLAVPRAASPRHDGCQAFEKGHNAHPVQVALAMKEVGDDHRFLAVRPDEVSAVEVDGRDVTCLVLRAVDGGSPLPPLLHHDAALVAALADVVDDFFVWEPRFGVLFVMTDQGRDVLGTGTLTLAVEAELGPCTAADASA